MAQPPGGKIYTVNLERTVGAHIQKMRPAVIIQNDLGNRCAPHTIIAAVRDAEGKGSLPVFVRLPKGTAGLKKASLIDCGHITTVAIDQLGRRIGTLPPQLGDEPNLALNRSSALL
jgi:mRNA interferase MazF